MSTCPHCGDENLEGDVFCTKCERRVKDMPDYIGGYSESLFESNTSSQQQIFEDPIQEEYQSRRQEKIYSPDTSFTFPKFTFDTDAAMWIIKGIVGFLLGVVLLVVLRSLIYFPEHELFWDQWSIPVIVFITAVTAILLSIRKKK